MGEFKEIKTQEELDEIIGKRLAREREKITDQYKDFLSPEDVQKKYEGYLSPAQVEEKYKGFISESDLNSKLAEKDDVIKKYEIGSVKTKVALSKGLPYEIAGRLNGETSEEIEADAEAFAKMMNFGGDPHRSTEPADNLKAAKSAAYAKLSQQLKGE